MVQVEVFEVATYFCRCDGNVMTSRKNLRAFSYISLPRTYILMKGKKTEIYLLFTLSYLSLFHFPLCLPLLNLD